MNRKYEKIQTKNNWDFVYVFAYMSEWVFLLADTHTHTHTHIYIYMCVCENTLIHSYRQTHFNKGTSE